MPSDRKPRGRQESPSSRPVVYGERDLAPTHVFNGKNNYDQWKVRIKTKLIARDLGNTIEKVDDRRRDEERCKREAIALDVIFNHLDDNVLRSLGNVKTPYEAMTKLNEKYEVSNFNQVIALRSQLQSLRLDDRKSAQSHLTEFESICNDLHAQNETMSEAERISWLLTSLPSSYSSVRAASSALAEAKLLTLSGVKNLILQEETQRKIDKLHVPSSSSSNSQSTPRSSALYVNNRRNCNFSSSANRKVSNENGNRPIKCFQCKGEGHIGRNCPKFGDDTPNPKPSKNNTKNVTPTTSSKANYTESTPKFEALVATVEPSTLVTASDHSGNFVLDSGATDHMVNEKKWLVNVVEFDSPQRVKCAKEGTFMLAYAYGRMYIYTEHEKNVIRYLDNVLYVPDLSINLLSAHVLTKKGYGINFECNEIKIYKKSSNIVVLSGSTENSRLPMVRIRIAKEFYTTAYLTNAEQDSQAEIWHRRFGHMPGSYLQKLMPTLRTENIKIENCTVCCRAKQRRNSCTERRTRATNPLEIVHTDIIGPISPESIFGEKYVISFLDDFTHYAVTQVLHNRSESAEKFEDFYKRATAKFNSKLVTLRCDNAREFILGNFRNFCDANGVVLQTAEPYTHQHNGSAERWNRTLMERTRALLFDAKMPVEFWTFAVYAATHILNRSPTTALEWKTPYLLWNGREPEFKYLKLFGSIAHTLIPYERRTKLQPKSTELVVVGYSTTGYVLYNPATKQSIESSNVLIDESRNYADLVASTNDLTWTPEEIDRLLIQEEPDPDIDIIYVFNDDPELAANITNLVSEMTFYEAVNGPDKENWLKAINEELQAIYSNDTWIPIPRSESEKPLDTVWVFRKKEDSSGKLSYKARLCVRGFREKTKYDVSDTYAPVAKFCLVRCLLILANKFNWQIEQIDVSNAFLNGPVKNRVTIEVPDGVNLGDKKNQVLLLKKSLYGLRTSPKNWNDTLNDALLKAGLKRSLVDSSIYFDDEFILLNHVDDMLITGSSPSRINEVISALKSKFKIKELGYPSKYLGVKIIHNSSDGTFELSQLAYIDEVLEDFGMTEANGTYTPMEPNLKIVNPIADGKSEYTLRKLLGCLSYIASCTRPDISYAVNYLSRFQNNANEELVKVCKRILCYVKFTKDENLRFLGKTDKILEVYSDSDFAGDISDRKSTSGLIVRIFGDCVDWKTKKQSSVSTSSAEAEYVALSSATTEIRAWKNLLKELKIESFRKPVPLYCDSSAAIAIATTCESKRTRHIDLSHHNVRDAVNNQEIAIRKIASKDQPADLMTKSLPRKTLDF